jgi:hypothetical protein
VVSVVQWPGLCTGLGLKKPQFNDFSNSTAVEEPNTTTDEMSHNGIEATIGKAVDAWPSTQVPCRSDYRTYH